MKKFTLIAACCLAASWSFGAVAQDDAEETYIYATYFYCDASGEEKADELFKKNTAPHWDAAVEDGTVKAWGYLRHHTGGKWRRLQYYSAGSVDALLAAQKKVGDNVDKAMGGNDDGFNSICKSHDDYIWQNEAGNAGTAVRGKVGLSVYQVCSFEGEERASEIVKEVFAPIYDKAVADGKITSWGSSSHVIGGKYRRLSTMTGDSFGAILKARGEIIEQIYGDGDNSVGAEFANICGSHSDYMWEIVHEKAAE